MIAPEVIERLPDPALDARIAAALSDDAKSSDVSALLPEVKAAAKAANSAAAEARTRALDPSLVGEDAKVARREMDDTSFLRDRLTEAASRLGERVAELKTLEADRILWAEHDRLIAERERLAEKMVGLSDPILQVAHTVSQIAICDREIKQLNVKGRVNYIPPVLSRAAPLIKELFEEVLVLDSFIAISSRRYPSPSPSPKPEAATKG
jgi:hypothetical protein